MDGATRTFGHLAESETTNHQNKRQHQQENGFQILLVKPTAEVVRKTGITFCQARLFLLFCCLNQRLTLSQPVRFFSSFNATVSIIDYWNLSELRLTRKSFGSSDLLVQNQIQSRSIQVFVTEFLNINIQQLTQIFSFESSHDLGFQLVAGETFQSQFNCQTSELNKFIQLCVLDSTFSKMYILTFS